MKLSEIQTKYGKPNKVTKEISLDTNTELGVLTKAVTLDEYTNPAHSAVIYVYEEQARYYEIDSTEAITTSQYPPISAWDTLKPELGTR